MLHGSKVVKMNSSDQSLYKERLLDAAGELIAAHGLEGLTAGKMANHVGLKRTIVHYHFGTMDHLLAAFIRRSGAAMRQNVLSGLHPATLGEDLWRLYRNAMPATEAFRARALLSDVVGEAYREVVGDIIAALTSLVREGYRLLGREPEIPIGTIAMAMLMSAQFAGVQRALGHTDEIDALDAYMKSLFAISAGQ